MLIFTSISRIFKGLLNGTGTIFSLLGLFAWDNYLTFLNLILPSKKPGSVYPPGAAGHDGIWPTFEAPNPEAGDSRCSCPALNAMANHGILPHNGRGISFVELGNAINKTFNFAPSFCYFVPWYAAQFLQRNYKTDTMDLEDLDVHNCIEHDASLTRHDAKYQVDQSVPDKELVEILLNHATGDGGKTLTAKDLSTVLSHRRAHSKENNGQYTLSTGQKFFGSSNSSTLLFFFGGNVSQLRTFLLEERLPDGWETAVRTAKGLTIASFNTTVNKVEFGITEGDPTKGGSSGLKGMKGSWMSASGSRDKKISGLP